jgi:hypothetical protein
LEEIERLRLVAETTQVKFDASRAELVKERQEREAEIADMNDMLREAHGSMGARISGLQRDLRSSVQQSNYTMVQSIISEVIMDVCDQASCTQVRSMEQHIKDLELNISELEYAMQDVENERQELIYQNESLELFQKQNALGMLGPLAPYADCSDAEDAAGLTPPKNRVDSSLKRGASDSEPMMLIKSPMPNVTVKVSQLLIGDCTTCKMISERTKYLELQLEEVTERELLLQGEIRELQGEIGELNLQLTKAKDDADSEISGMQGKIGELNFQLAKAKDDAFWRMSSTAMHSFVNAGLSGSSSVPGRRLSDAGP